MASDQDKDSNQSEDQLDQFDQLDLIDQEYIAIQLHRITKGVSCRVPSMLRLSISNLFLGIFLVYDFWTPSPPPLLSILYMGLTRSFLT